MHLKGTGGRILTFPYLLSLILFIQYFESNRAKTSCQCVRSGKYFLKEWRYSDRMIILGACSFLMGSPPSVAIRGDGETPVRLVKIHRPFWIDKTEVTKGQFSKFVRATRYRTTAEDFGTSFVFEPKITDQNDTRMTRGPWWWREKKFVTWKSDLCKTTRLHPVTHVSWADASAFCEWRQGQLPSESQWEFACRGGLQNCLYPWGNSLKLDGSHMANIWQGRFPIENTMKDGFLTTAPVGSFSPNAYGLHDMAGNVWEWVNDIWQQNSHVRIQKGGSFMCHKRHCFRYRCGARTKGSWDSTSSNLGFRCVHNVLS